ncbi:MAG TPA: prolyl oligopeptidase family serine peptidase [Nitrospiraceae bacterium]|nr:prolyl oligopeptidase family serine peptidase [Nitrospiraceae bacterium]
MSLYEERPDSVRPDPSRKDTFEFSSPVDGCQVKVDIYSPSSKPDKALPLLFGPHPIGWTASEDYHLGFDGYTRGYHRGYFGLADKYQILIAMPHGHQHREDLCSLAGPEQIEDMAYLIRSLSDFGYSVDRSRVYACGLSMGGQETLVLAGKHPDQITAVVAFNPIVDLAAWHEELATSTVLEIREYDTATRIAHEVGGTPGEVPEKYTERSATHYIEGLAQVPTLAFWSDCEIIIPRQLTRHTYPLYQRVKALNPNSPFAEYNHTHIHGPIEFDQRTRWQLHEWNDYELAIRWLLCHQK